MMQTDLEGLQYSLFHRYSDWGYCFIHFARKGDSAVDSSKSCFPKCGTNSTGDMRYLMGVAWTDAYFNI